MGPRRFMPLLASLLASLLAFLPVLPAVAQAAEGNNIGEVSSNEPSVPSITYGPLIGTMSSGDSVYNVVYGTPIVLDQNGSVTFTGPNGTSYTSPSGATSVATAGNLGVGTWTAPGSDGGTVTFNVYAAGLSFAWQTGNAIAPGGSGSFTVTNWVYQTGTGMVPSSLPAPEGATVNLAVYNSDGQSVSGVSFANGGGYFSTIGGTTLSYDTTSLTTSVPETVYLPSTLSPGAYFLAGNYTDPMGPGVYGIGMSPFTVTGSDGVSETPEREQELQTVEPGSDQSNSATASDTQKETLDVHYSTSTSAAQVQLTLPAGLLPNLTPVSAVVYGASNQASLLSGTTLPGAIGTGPVPVGPTVSISDGGTTFVSGNATLALPYDPAAVPSGDQVGVFFDNNGTWSNAGVAVNSVTGTVYATLPHFSTWTVLAYQPASSGTSTGGGGGGGGGFFPTTGSNSATATSASGTVAATGTTTVTTSGGSVSLAIPQGALPAGTQVTVNVVSPSSVAAPAVGEAVVGDVITIQDGGVALSAPVPATFTYDAAALHGQNPNRVAVYYLDPTTNTWHYVGGRVNPGTAAVTATLHHFSTYAVMANTQTFSDIPAGFWGRSDIDALLGAGIISGFPNGTFAPNGSVTRAQFAKMLALALGLTPSATSSPFADVPSGAWYAPYVDAAAQAGIVNGVGSGLFDPNATISRQEMVTMIARAIGATASTSRLSTFSDQGRIASWAQGAVALALKDNLVKGMTPTTFDPTGTSTRAQAAAVIARLLRQNGTM